MHRLISWPKYILIQIAWAVRFSYTTNYLLHLLLLVPDVWDWSGNLAWGWGATHATDPLQSLQLSSAPYFLLIISLATINAPTSAPACNFSDTPRDRRCSMLDNLSMRYVVTSSGNSVCATFNDKLVLMSTKA